MFDDGAVIQSGSVPDRPSLRSAELAAMAAALGRLDRDVDDHERIEQLRALEQLKNAAAACQARIAVAFDDSQRAEQAAAGVPARLQGADVGAQIALARRESPHRAARLLGLARGLVHEMPHTLRAMERGEVSEWRATLIARETACLERDQRTAIDAELWTDAARVESLGDKRLAAEVRRRAYQADPHSSVARARLAEDERRVTIRPAPDTMCYLTALLPVAQGVAAYAALTKAADGARAAGDPRGKGQVMADTLVERLTGQATADSVPVRVGLVMTDMALLAGGDEPAHLENFGPVPSRVARGLVTVDQRSRAWVTRLYTSPATGQLVATDARSYRFPKALARLIRQRDQFCRTPWCGAPIRHVDHVQPFTEGGDTSRRNGQGLCEACNHHKQAIGWQARPRPGPDHVVETVTPTGHRYRSTPSPVIPPSSRTTRSGPWPRGA